MFRQGVTQIKTISDQRLLIFIRDFFRHALLLRFKALVLFSGLLFAPLGIVQCQNLHLNSASVIQEYEGRPVGSVEVTLEGVNRNNPNALRTIQTFEKNYADSLQIKAGAAQGYSALKVRQSLIELFDSGRAANARVEVYETNNQSSTQPRPLRVKFIVLQRARIGEVRIQIIPATGSGVTEDELRGRLSMLEVSTRVSESEINQSADNIQAYLRSRGFYLAEVNTTQQISDTGIISIVTFNVKPGAQSKVAEFNIQIDGFDSSTTARSLRLQKDVPFTRFALNEDLRGIRQAIIKSGHLAPLFDEPQIRLDSTSNLITINITGNIGPKGMVTLEGYKLNPSKLRELVPILREGTMDQSAIVEGARRIRNDLQEQGYFFAEVTPVCSVSPPLSGSNAPSIPALPNTPQGECDFIDPQELHDRTVQITYKAAPGRQFKLSDIRLEGTTHFTIEDFAADLQTQTASALGFIPYLGYRNGYTSQDLLEQDRNTTASRLRDAGYRRATVDLRRGVSIDGENLIITFVVDEGPVTKLSDIEITGNQIFDLEKIRGVMQSQVNTNFSSSRAQTDAERIATFYANQGYIDTKVETTLVELPKESEQERVKMAYGITEGSRTEVNRIFVAGIVRTKPQAILSAIPLKEKKVLRADDLTASESILYGTDAFSQVGIRTEVASTSDTTKKNDNVIITVTEAKPHILGYGFGYSTDTGPLGTFDIRHNNMFGMLRQGTIRLRASQRQQLAQIEYTDPRFRVPALNQLTPLTFSLQYQRDTSVTRFFRSSIDRGDNGIVQRLDSEGNPIDSFGNRVDSPSINRFTFSATTQHAFGRKEKPNSRLFLRYSYEDVRLFNIESLLIADVLRPDTKVRLSRFGATFVRDTRDSPIDTSRGEFLTLDYAIAVSALGGNISFQKFEGTYRRYFKLGTGDRGFGGTILAGGVSLGLSSIFNPTDRDGNGVIDDVDKTLPISERFFSGGSTTLRGFGFEEAGPHIIVPQGTFFNSNGESVFLPPNSVPIGGNALAVVNLEARVPIVGGFSLIPFYDGGNVFRQVGDIFQRGTPEGEDPNLRAHWTNTVGLGLSFKTPVGPLSVDYGFLLNPPAFQVLPGEGGPATLRLPQSQIHIRFGRAF